MSHHLNFIYLNLESRQWIMFVLFGWNVTLKKDLSIPTPYRIKCTGVVRGERVRHVTQNGILEARPLYFHPPPPAEFASNSMMHTPSARRTAHQNRHQAISLISSSDTRPISSADTLNPSYLTQAPNIKCSMFSLL